jgi:cell division protein FtsZ
MPDLANTSPRIVVIGVGGAGGNAVNNMVTAGLNAIEFVAANTDTQALAASKAEHRIQLGSRLTEGLGAGSKPEVGEAAAEEALEEINARICGAHMVFIAAGMGGGTGTGAAYVVARAAKELGILTIAIVTKPFQFEGLQRMRNAEAGIAALRHYVDTLLVIPNENLFRVATDRTTFAEAFLVADQVLYSGIACLVDLIVQEGLINLDLADVKAVLSGMGTAMMGVGEASGEQRSVVAAEEAIVNPLLDNVTLKGAKSLLLSITGGRDLTLWEVDEAANRVRQEIDPDANIIVGAILDESLGDRMRVSIVASGMPGIAKVEAPGSSDAPTWKPRCDPEAGTLTGPEQFGWRLTDAITAGNVQTKARGTRKSSARSRSAPGGSAGPVDGLPKRSDPRRGGPSKPGPSLRKRSATELPRLKPAPPDSTEVEAGALPRSSPPTLETATIVGWPQHWAGTDEPQRIAPQVAVPSSLPARQQQSPQRLTLLRRLAGLVGGKRVV